MLLLYGDDEFDKGKRSSLSACFAHVRMHVLAMQRRNSSSLYHLAVMMAME
jgi:hypothetical protein